MQKGTLADELARREKRKDHFSENTALVLFLQICEGIQHLHQDSDLGGPYAHRDIKPHNILLRDDYTPIIMDLGKYDLDLQKLNIYRKSLMLYKRSITNCSGRCPAS